MWFLENPKHKLKNKKIFNTRRDPIRQPHKREMTVYPSSGYRGPMSNSVVSFVFRGYNESLAGDSLVLSYGSSAVRFLRSE